MADISGVWSSSSAGLIAIDARGTQPRFLIADDPKVVRLGKIDVAKRTVQLLLRRTSDGKQIVWILHRVSNANGSPSYLDIALDDGSHADLPFVRKLTRADFDRIANLYSGRGTYVTVNPAPALPETDAVPAPRVNAVRPPERSGSQVSANDAPSQRSRASDLSAMRRDAEIDSSSLEKTRQFRQSGEETPQPSFDCATALLPVEHLICSDTFLVAEDARMESLLEKALHSSYARQARLGQRFWRNRVRDRCGDSDCLQYAYAKRIEELNALLISRAVPYHDDFGMRRPPDNVTIVREFYRALGHGDSEAASALISPDSRQSGQLSESGLHSFYLYLASAFVLDGVDDAGSHQVIARYRYVSTAGHLCAGYAFVKLVETDSGPLIDRIDRANGC
jgi:hypothetical protein